MRLVLLASVAYGRQSAPNIATMGHRESSQAQQRAFKLPIRIRAIAPQSKVVNQVSVVFQVVFLVGLPRVVFILRANLQAQAFDPRDPHRVGSVG